MATERARQPPQNVALVSQRPVPAGASMSPSSPSGPSKKATTTGRGGARRLGVDDQGQFYYKNTPSSTLMASLQLGLQHSIGSIAPKPRRDILMTDFEVIETTEFPAAGSDSTPGHKYKDFTFKTYSPEAFRFFREAFGILPEDFLVAMCDQPLRELSNPGASGSLFYLSADDAFIMKTVQKKEARFLQKLLPGYYLNMTQHKRTLLPKFFGLYRYKSGSVNIRIVVMNNLLPSGVIYHEKFDLKGSTYKRKANSSEVKKKSPTFKDLDFMEKHEEGIILAPDKYDALLHSVDRDCKVLESFGIMDYSLLLGVHNIDQAIRERAEASQTLGIEVAPTDVPIPSRIELSKNFSIISAEDIPSLLAEEQQQRHHYPEGYIQGRIHGDRVMFYLGVIDILQSYRLKKKLEHGFKSVIADGTTVSVHNPTFYARRFQEFMTTQVFKKDKIKFKTRKNSTNSQLRGRRIIQSGGRAQAVGGADRHAAGESRVSPPTDLPSYHQAMKGAGSGSGGMSVDTSARGRSKSASVGTSLPIYSARTPSTGASGKTSSSGISSEPSTTTTSKATSEEPSQATSSDNALKKVAESNKTPVQSADSGEGNLSVELVISDPGLIRATENVARAEEQIRSSQQQELALNGKSVPVTAVADPDGKADGNKDEQDGRKTPENSETEFARNVRGTSTPLNPTPSQSPSESRTFNAFNGDINTKESEDRDGSKTVEDNHDKNRMQVEQENAMDDSTS